MRSIFPGLLICACVAGCNSKPTVTKQQAEEFSDKLEASIAKRDPSFLNTAIDFNGMKEKVKEQGKGELTKQSYKYLTQFIEWYDGGNSLIKALNKRGVYRLIRTYKADGRYHAVFQRSNADSSHYQDFELTMAGNKVKVADITFYPPGKSLSEHFTNMLLELSNDQPLYKRNSVDEYIDRQ